jgi:hypothetical protein
VELWRQFGDDNVSDNLSAEMKFCKIDSWSPHPGQEGGGRDRTIGTRHM